MDQVEGHRPMLVNELYWCQQWDWLFSLIIQLDYCIGSDLRWHCMDQVQGHRPMSVNDLYIGVRSGIDYLVWYDLYESLSNISDLQSQMLLGIYLLVSEMGLISIWYGLFQSILIKDEPSAQNLRGSLDQIPQPNSGHGAVFCLIRGYTQIIEYFRSAMTFHMAQSQTYWCQS